MNNVHPIFQPILNAMQHGPRMGRVSAALADGQILEDMRGVIRQHLSKALIECGVLALDLNDLDADQVLTDLRAEFDPTLEEAAVQDLFADAFHASVSKIKDSGGEPIARVKALPSGEAL